MTSEPPTVRFSWGNGTRMDDVADEEAELVLTSPPYFSPSTEPLLRQPVREQDQLERVEREVVAYALSLRPVFDEIARILKRSGVLIIQTKDVRYSGWLIGITGVHRELVEGLGLRMLTRLWWQPPFDSRKHVPPHPRPGSGRLFRVFEVEEFQVYGRPGIARPSGPRDVTDEEIASAQSPLWHLPGPGGRRSHPYQSPASVVRRLIGLYTSVGDLVVDPFAGTGTILEAAIAMGRHAAGREIDRDYASAASHRLALATKRYGRAEP